MIFRNPQQFDKYIAQQETFWKGLDEPNRPDSYPCYLMGIDYGRWSITLNFLYLKEALELVEAASEATISNEYSKNKS